MLTRDTSSINMPSTPGTASSYVTATGDNLRCTICPNDPKFTNASHLLTHLGSKLHLKKIFELELRAKVEPLAARHLENFKAWYTGFGIDRALAVRQKMKEKRKREEEKENLQLEEDRKTFFKESPSVKRERLEENFTTMDTNITFPSTPLFPALNDSPLPTSVNPLATVMPRGMEQLIHGASDDESHSIIPEEPESEREEEEEADSTGLPPSAKKLFISFKARTPTNCVGKRSWETDDVRCHSILDSAEINDPKEVKVKGKAWPGMRVFDWATPELRARRLANGGIKKSLSTSPLSRQNIKKNAIDSPLSAINEGRKASLLKTKSKSKKKFKKPTVASNTKGGKGGQDEVKNTTDQSGGNELPLKNGETDEAITDPGPFPLAMVQPMLAGYFPPRNGGGHPLFGYVHACLIQPRKVPSNHSRTVDSYHYNGSMYNYPYGDMYGYFGRQYETPFSPNGATELANQRHALSHGYQPIATMVPAPIEPPPFYNARVLRSRVVNLENAQNLAAHRWVERADTATTCRTVTSSSTESLSSLTSATTQASNSTFNSQSMASPAGSYAASISDDSEEYEDPDAESIDDDEHHENIVEDIDQTDNATEVSELSEFEDEEDNLPDPQDQYNH